MLQVATVGSVTNSGCAIPLDSCNSIGLMKTLCPSDVPKQPTTPSKTPNTSLFCWHIFFQIIPMALRW